MTATLDKFDALAGESSSAPQERSKAPSPRPRASWRLLDWRVVLAGVLAGGILHIANVFSAPFMARGTAFQRLGPSLPVNRVQILPPPIPGAQPLPFMLPDALYAICRYDLSVDSLRVVAVLPEPGWTLSLHSVHGDNFYAMAGQEARTEITFVVVPGGERGADVGTGPRRLGTVDLQVTAPTHEGFVMVRAPLKGLAYRAETEALLSRTACSAVKR